MRTRDFLNLTGSSLIAHRMRSFLTALGIAVGIAAVVLLTSIGEGVHQFVLSEFTQFGTTLVGINPGKATTAGTSMGMFGTERPLTIEDAQALKRLPFARAVVPFVQGNAEVEAGNRRRRTTVYGAGPDMPEAFRMKIKSGRFLPDDDPTAPRALAVLGSKLRQTLAELLYRLSIRGGSSLIFQNPDDLQLFADHDLSRGCRTSLILGSGVDVERFSPTAPSEDRPRDRVRVLFVGRLLREKGVCELLEAAARASGAGA